MKMKCEDDKRALRRKRRELYRNIQGELWKMRHTLIPALHILIPAAGILLFLSYYSFASWSDAGKISGYIEAISVVLPLVIGVVCSMSVEQEEKGHFQTLLGVAVHRKNPLLAKWIVLSGMGLAAILLAVLGFAGGYRILTGTAVLSAKQYLILAGVLWIGSMDLYLLHLFLNLAFSRNVSLCAGTAQLVVSALFLTGLGEGRWQFFPCAWGGRWSAYLLQCWMGSMRVSREYMTESLAVGAAVTAVLWCAVLLWFPFYEGRVCRD